MIFAKGIVIKPAFGSCVSEGIHPKVPQLDLQTPAVDVSCTNVNHMMEQKKVYFGVF